MAKVTPKDVADFKVLLREKGIDLSNWTDEGLEGVLQEEKFVYLLAEKNLPPQLIKGMIYETNIFNKISAEFKLFQSGKSSAIINDLCAKSGINPSELLDCKLVKQMQVKIPGTVDDYFIVDVGFAKFDDITGNIDVILIENKLSGITDYTKSQKMAIENLAGQGATPFTLRSRIFEGQGFIYGRNVNITKWIRSSGTGEPASSYIAEVFRPVLGWPK